MKQLNVFCEGPTEQGFCEQVLRPHLFPTGDGIIHTLAVGKSAHHHVYGVNKYGMLRKFILNTIRGRANHNVYFTSLLDLYALPSDFPGMASNTRNADNPYPYVEALEKEIEDDISHYQFYAHLQLHEYETMLFAAPEAFAIAFDNCGEQIEDLKRIAASEPSIEHIDDGIYTAPSKRIISILPAYGGMKSIAGPDIAEFIGIGHIRAKCPHFDQWVSRLENIHWEQQE